MAQEGEGWGMLDLQVLMWQCPIKLLPAPATPWAIVTWLQPPHSPLWQLTVSRQSADTTPMPAKHTASALAVLHPSCALVPGSTCPYCAAGAALHSRSPLGKFAVLSRGVGLEHRAPPLKDALDELAAAEAAVQPLAGQHLHYSKQQQQACQDTCLLRPLYSCSPES